MKSEKLIKAIGGIDDDIIESADKKTAGSSRGPRWVKIAVAAAVLAAIAIGAVALLPAMMKNGGVETSEQSGDDRAVTSMLSWDDVGITSAVTRPMFYTVTYVWRVSEGKYSSYESGMVIEAEKVGKLLEKVRVNAGWVSSLGGSVLLTEYGEAEIYLIEGVSPDVGVAVKFLDKFEKLTTEHYYALLNPDTDPGPLEQYKKYGLFDNPAGGTGVVADENAFETTRTASDPAPGPEETVTRTAPVEEHTTATAEPYLPSPDPRR
ncbi:MAG: hypothetical protein J6V48_08630 [Clostridia bacterium]|nr:hypothetical protein [Clostridia bacterium]